MEFRVDNGRGQLLIYGIPTPTTLRNDCRESRRPGNGSHVLTLFSIGTCDAGKRIAKKKKRTQTHRSCRVPFTRDNLICIVIVLLARKYVRRFVLNFK